MKKFNTLLCAGLVVLFFSETSFAQSRRDEVLRRRGGSTSRDRAQVNRNQGRNTGRVDNRGRDRVVRREPVRRNPVVRREPVRRNPVVRREPIRRDRPTRVTRPIDSRRPNGNFRRNTHQRVNRGLNHSRRFQHRHDYHRTIDMRFVFANRWLRVGVGYANGYSVINSYPYYVYNGYRHRYSHYDYCDYELVDGHGNYVEQGFYGLTCAEAYDRCADYRDDLNWRYGNNRFFCSEPYEY